MHYLTEDPSYLLIALGLAVLGCLVALKITQQGKFLIWAGGLAAVAVLVFGLEHYWVTDAERVERVVYDLAGAVEASDVDRIKSHLDEHVTVGMRNRTIDGSIPMKLVFALLKQTRFDFVRIGQLTTSAGSQTKMGKAEFKVSATGVFNEGGHEMPLGSLGTEWSLSFREVSPGVWKVTRIQAIKVPPQVARYLFGR
jgi:hypothetical protein